MQNNKFPLVSIITATFNSEKYIEDTIVSVLKQSYNNIEYIIVDGLSKDNTLEKIYKYKEKINTIISEPDSGIYNAFNKGINVSKGDIIYFLNSDDYLYSNTIIQEIVNEFVQDSSIKLMYGNVMLINYKTGINNIIGSKIEVENLKNREMIPHQGVFVKKELFQKFGIFNEKYKIASDFDFIIKCFKHLNTSNIKYIDNIITTCREGGVSTSNQYKKMLMSEFNEIVKIHFKRDNNINISDNDWLFREWLESILLEDKGITNKLKKYSIKNVAIFGTRGMASYIYMDCIKEGIQVKYFIDNNVNMQEKLMYGINVKSLNDIEYESFQAVIVSIEGEHDKKVIEMIKDALPSIIYVFSWKDLLNGE